MTIAIAGNFTEGVVLGAESALSYSAPGNASDIRQVYNGAQKIYHLGAARDCSDSPFGAMLFGSNEFCGHSWRNIFGLFRRSVQGREFTTAIETAEALVEFLKARKRGTPQRAGLFLGGYGTNDTHARCIKLDVEKMSLAEVPYPDVAWDGIPHIVQRLIHGIDPQIIDGLTKEYDGLGITKKAGAAGKERTVPLADDIIRVIRDHSATVSGNANMPLRDAIDFVYFLVYVTVKYFKFNPGHNACGGEVELAVITLDRGFRRIRRKPLDFFIPTLGPE